MADCPQITAPAVGVPPRKLSPESIRIELDFTPRLCDGDTLAADVPPVLEVTSPEGATPLTATDSEFIDTRNPGNELVSPGGIRFHIAGGSAGANYLIRATVGTAAEDVIAAIATVAVGPSGAATVSADIPVARIPAAAPTGTSGANKVWKTGPAGEAPDWRDDATAAAGSGLDQDAVDARVAAGTEDWAHEGDTTPIPAPKLTNAPGQANPTDAQIGDKAFSNPPSDLTDPEKGAVRTATGSADAALAQRNAQNITALETTSAANRRSISSLESALPDPPVPAAVAEQRDYVLRLPAIGSTSVRAIWARLTGGGGGTTLPDFSGLSEEMFLGGRLGNLFWRAIAEVPDTPGTSTSVGHALTVTGENDDDFAWRAQNDIVARRGVAQNAAAIGDETANRNTAFSTLQGQIAGVANLQSVTVATAPGYVSTINSQASSGSPLILVVSADISGTRAGAAFEWDAGDVIYYSPASAVGEFLFNLGDSGTPTPTPSPRSLAWQTLPITAGITIPNVGEQPIPMQFGVGRQFGTGITPVTGGLTTTQVTLSPGEYRIDVKLNPERTSGTGNATFRVTAVDTQDTPVTHDEQISDDGDVVLIFGIEEERTVFVTANESTQANRNPVFATGTGAYAVFTRIADSTEASGGGLDQDAVDARVRALVDDFAEEGSTDEVPEPKIPAAIARQSALDDVVSDVASLAREFTLVPDYWLRDTAGSPAARTIVAHVHTAGLPSGTTHVSMTIAGIGAAARLPVQANERYAFVFASASVGTLSRRTQTTSDVRIGFHDALTGGTELGDTRGNIRNVSVAPDATQVQALTDGAAIAWNVSAGEVADVTLGGNRTLAVPTGGSDGTVALLRVLQDSTGGRTLTLHSSISRGGRDAPTVASAAAARSYLSFMRVGTTWVYMGIIADE